MMFRNSLNNSEIQKAVLREKPSIRLFNVLCKSNLHDSEYQNLLVCHHLKTQPLISAHDLFIGSYLYLCALGCEDVSKKTTMLKKAANAYASFHALQYLFFSILLPSLKEQPKEKSRITQTEREIIDYAEKAKKHLTPGYLLSAHAYIWLADLYHHDGNAEIEAAQAYNLALIYLYCALELEPYSKEAIYNAYGPEGLSKSNVFGNRDIQSMISYAYEKYAIYYGSAERPHSSYFHKEAKKIINEIKQNISDQSTSPSLVIPSISRS